MIPTQNYLSKSRVNPPLDMQSRSKAYSQASNKHFTRSTNKLTTYQEKAEESAFKNPIEKENYPVTKNYKNIRKSIFREESLIMPIQDGCDYSRANQGLNFYQSTVTKRQQPFNHYEGDCSRYCREDKSKKKVSTKSSKNIPLYQRLKNVQPGPTPFFYEIPKAENRKIQKEQASNRKNNNYLRQTYEAFPQPPPLDTSYFKDPSKTQGSLRSTVDSKSRGQLLSHYEASKPSFHKYVEQDLRTTPSFSWGKERSQYHLESRLFVEPNRDPRLEDFMLGECKGQGRFGKVFLAVHKRSGFICALKKIRKDAVKFMIDQFIQEIKIQQYLNHPNLVKIYGYFTDKEHFYMLVQYMEEGCLYSLLKKHSKKLPEPETTQKLFEICSGIKAMHDENIVHRDLKPENVVLTHGVCKICDFGWAAVCVDRRNTYCGTLDYVCPQIVDGQQYDSSVDIWCLGVLAYEMMCGKAPFYDISRKKTMQNIKTCTIDTFPSYLSKKAVNFISMILKRNPEARVGIKQLLSSQFLIGSHQ